MGKAEKPARQFAICIETGEYCASLERWKMYEVRLDPDAEAHDQLRVVDESGEDYLFPKEYFQAVELPPAVARLSRASARPSPSE